MPDAKSLDIFIGRWTTTGSFVAPKPGEPETMTATPNASAASSLPRERR